MIERINLLLKAKNISARQFAEEIGIQPSGMSHILSGRNNPSLDFVMKVVKRWPEVNINWLMLGKGEMYANVPLNVQPKMPIETAGVVEDSAEEQYDLFTQPEQMAKADDRREETSPAVPAATLKSAEKRVAPSYGDTIPVDDASNAASDYSKRDPSDVSHQVLQAAENAAEVVRPTSIPVHPKLKEKKVVKMIVMYDDHSFAEYYPE